jgi:hypothetical protein
MLSVRPSLLRNDLLPARCRLYCEWSVRVSARHLDVWGQLLSHRVMLRWRLLRRRADLLRRNLPGSVRQWLPAMRDDDAVLSGVIHLRGWNAMLPARYSPLWNRQPVLPDSTHGYLLHFCLGLGCLLPTAD